MGTALIVILTLIVAAACSSSGGKKAANAAAGGGVSAGHATTPHYTFAVITHAQPGDTFWDIIRAGASAAAAKDNVTYHYTNNQDPTQQAQLIQDAFLAGAGGFFVDVTIHDLDTARWMVGEIVEVTAHGAALSDPGFADIGDIDTAVVVLRFASGALGVIDDSRAAGYGYECSTEVMGRNATVRIDHPQYRNYEWRTPGSASHGLPRDFEERFPEAYVAELESFARCVRDGEPPRVTAHDALAAFDLARAAEESWRRGRTVMVEPQRAGADVIYTVKQESR